MIASMFSEAVSPERASMFASAMRRFHPAGFRTMARSLASAGLRNELGRIDIPTLVLSGDADVRAPLAVGKTLHAAIPTSTLAVLPGAGHVSSVKAPELFTDHLRIFLHASSAVALQRPPSQRANEPVPRQMTNPPAEASDDPHRTVMANRRGANPCALVGYERIASRPRSLQPSV